MPTRPARLVTLLAAAAVAAAGAVPAAAEVKRAGSVLPPGQSGFVSAGGLASGTGSPHLTDQTRLFLDFSFKPATFGQPGREERPRPGVRIVRDSFGVPAITGGSDADVWFGAGYAVAQDRLFQLELFRRATTGRLSEILGKSFLVDDIIARRDYYTAPELESQLAKLPPPLRARFDSYRDGVNAWIAETERDPGKVPGEFAAVGAVPARWTVLDSAAIGVFLARTVPSGDGEELANARALRALGPRVFNQLLPLRTPGQVATVPRGRGLFPSQPGRTRRQEARAFTRSRAFVAGVKLPRAAGEAGQTASAAAKGDAPDGMIGRVGGSNMWAIRGPGSNASLFNGPQLGFSIPELFVELELHGPGTDVRGVTAAGVPVIGIGHNGRVAWGLTSGLSDEDDLYAEQLEGGAESYRFRGQARAMECRNETFSFRPPPSGFIPSTSQLAGTVDKLRGNLEAGSQTERICRTVHGPVQDRADGVAYARRYAIWNREIETIEGLAAVNDANDIGDVDRALDRVTWNENLMAADSRGNIGYWHPGLLPLRPLGYDERLPYPGTGEAEWRGLLPPDRRPQVINPPQGYLFQWNNVPSHGWTAGDGPARERLTGGYHRAAWLERVVRRASRSPGYESTAGVDRLAGAYAQQRLLASRPLKRARTRARGRARVVLDTILAWSGDYNTTDERGTVDPGVAAWDAFKEAAVGRTTARFGQPARALEGGQSTSHEFDATNLEAYALRTLDARGYRLAASAASGLLERRLNSPDPARWREPRRLYKPSAQGAAEFPEPFPFFDRGTWQQVVELGP